MRTIIATISISITLIFLGCGESLVNLSRSPLNIQNSRHNLYPETRKAAIMNLLNGLNSDNYGLRTSSAYMLGELRADEAVIPLMKMLRTEKNEDGRIVAALALYKIKDLRGVFTVKQALEVAEIGKDLTEVEFYLCPGCGNIQIGKPGGKCEVCGTLASKFIKL